MKDTLIRNSITQILIASLLITSGINVFAQDAEPVAPSSPGDGVSIPEPAPARETIPAPDPSSVLQSILGDTTNTPSDTPTSPSEEPPAPTLPTPEKETTPPPEEPAATPPPEEESASSASLGSGDLAGGANGTPNTIKQVIPEVDQTTGALVFNYPINIPPGRKGMQPDLSLTYNSLSTDPASILGHGWNIDIPYIRRINRKGVNKLYDTEAYFESSLTGELVAASGSVATYFSKVDNGEFLKFERASSTWTMTDKFGKIYSFGNSSSTRQADPSSSTKIFAWMLSEVRDLNGNYITYEYFKDQGQIYPSKIRYTEYGTSTTPFEIEFARQTRLDTPLKFDMGFTATTTYRIKEILVKHNSSLAKKYALGYASSTSGVRELLDTITEYGRTEASSTVILPASDFDYQGFDAAFSSGSLSCPDPINSTDGVIFIDVNGDGLTDILKRTDTASSTYLNDGDATWSLSTAFNAPLVFWDNSTTTVDRGVRAADINGDGRVDLVKRLDSDQAVYLNSTTSLGWVQADAAWNVPLALVNAGVADNGVRLLDINGDGLPDFMRTYSGSPVTTEVYLNDGSGWNQDTGWSSPVLLQEGTILGDFNNDGLVDISQSYAINNGSTWLYRQTYFHNGGKSWSGVSDFTPPVQYEVNSIGSDRGVREADINGDGYSDLIQGMTAVGQNVYINYGTGWRQGDWNPSWNFVDASSNDLGVRLADYDGDGMIDALDCNTGGGSTDNFWLNPSIKADLMTQVKSPYGGTVNIEYDVTPAYQDGSGVNLNPNLPFILDIVSRITKGDGINATSTQAFSYHGGRQYWADPYDRKMAGFSKVVSTNSASNTTTFFYHQGDTSSSTIGEYNDHFSKIGKIYRIEVANSAGNIYSKTTKKWDKIASSTTTFVKLVNALGMTYDGDSDHKDKAEDYRYNDDTGNLTEEIEWGEVTGSDDGTFTDIGGDMRTTSLTYASNTTDYIFALPSVETTVNGSSTKIRETRYYYDNEPPGYVDNGNLTKQESWRLGPVYIDIEKTYSGYGLVTQEKDPRDKITTYAYDTWNLYPATSTNPLSQSTGYVYDYSSGKVTQRTDPNGLVFTLTLDGLDRVIEEKQPDLTTPTTLITKATIAYTDAYNGSSILRTNYLTSATTTLQYTYLDGFGRVIQTRTEAEDANTFVVADTVYNNVERVQKESLPYFASGSVSSTATTTSALLVQYTYDPMLRVASTTNAVGTVSRAYDDWQTLITDARGKLKHLYSDAYGNLIQVDETNASSTYTTTYQYDLNNNLTKITDALGNVRNFTYDGLSRRLTAEDLHASGDGTFGAWTYAYDNSSNLTQTDDPNSQTVQYAYDDLNRVLTENYTGSAGTEITYTYDECTNGIGRLCTASSTGAFASYFYNALGGIGREIKTVSSTAYQTDYTYDRQGNIVTITNPDNSIIKYIYNAAGLLEAVLWKEQ